MQSLPTGVTRSLAPGTWLVLVFSCVGGILMWGEQIREDVGARGAGSWERVRSSPAYGLEGGSRPRPLFKRPDVILLPKIMSR